MTSVPPPQTVPEEPPPVAPPPARDSDIPPWPRVDCAGRGGARVLGLARSRSCSSRSRPAGPASSLSHPTPAVSLIARLRLRPRASSPRRCTSRWCEAASRPADFGFRRIACRLGIKAFVLAGVGYYVVTAALRRDLQRPRHREAPQASSASTSSTAARSRPSVFVCVIAPIAEEFFFRGFFFGALRG